jgi:outer membrane receptor protein involved in Fe transport
MFLILSTAAFGATTGKVTGVITDASNNQPLVGVSVAVDGTSWGAVTNPDGRYTILNVPVGTYTLRISAVGYNTLEVTNVEVHADLATYQSHAMTTSVTELAEVITVTVEQPLVVRDKTATIDIVRSEEIQAMPTRGFEEIIGLQNSVVRMNANSDIAQRGGANTSGQGSSINLRGGRPSEVAYYVDGFSQQDPLTGLSTANISNNAIEEISVASGAFSAEYGHVASGIVNVITKSGTDEYSVEVEGTTDNLGLWDKYVFDHNFYTADIGGPIPGMEKGYFYFSGERRYLQDRTPSPKTKETFERYGLTNNDDYALPNNSLNGWSYQGKIDLNLTNNLKLTLSGNGSQDFWQLYQHFYNNPDQPGQIEHTPRYEDKNWGVNAKITHTLNADNFYNLSFSYFWTERFRGDGILLRDDGANRLEAYQQGGATNPEMDVHNLFREGDSIVSSIDSITDPDHPDTSFFLRPGLFDDWLIRQSSYYGIKGDYNSQLNANNTLKFGFDFQRHTMRRYRDLNPSLGYRVIDVNRYGFDSLGNPVGTDEQSADEAWKHGVKNPINLGIYLQDRFDWRGLILNIGVRFDYFDYKAKRIRNESRPFDPDGRLDETNPGYPFPPDAVLDSLANVVDEGDLEDSEKFKRLSPRVGISFPISDNTQMHINYGQFYQRPNLQNLYIGYEFLEARTLTGGSFFPFPSPNLGPEKTTQYEVGMTHQLGEYTAVDLTAYYKDVQDLTQAVHISPAFPQVYDNFGNQDYGTIKGVDLGVVMRRNHNISMNLKYSLSYATGTGSYARSVRNILWKNSEGIPKSTNPLDYDQRHTLIGMFDIRTGKGEGPDFDGFRPLENFGFNAIFQLGSGTPYTPTRVYDAITSASVDQNPTGGVNSANLPWSFQIDVKLERTFYISNFKFVPYVVVKNLLDTENIGSVYEGTGEPNRTGYLETDEGVLKSSHPTLGEEYNSRYHILEDNPKNYLNPRMIFAGMRISF